MRTKLINVAIEKFGKRGFDAVGTREIAAAVDTPMSSITYHFGGKEGLYQAAAEHIFEHLTTHVAPEAQDLPGPDATREERVAAICNVMRRMGTFMLSAESAPFSLFIGREQQEPSQAVLDLLRERVLPMMLALAAQIRLLRPELSEERARALTVFLFGTTITLRHSRASLGLLLGNKQLETAETQEMLLDQLEMSARALLKGEPE